MESGRIHQDLKLEGNELAKDLCTIGGWAGIVFSIFAYMTAAKKVPYLTFPFIIGSVLMGGVFCAIFVTTISQETSIFYKR